MSLILCIITRLLLYVYVVKSHRLKNYLKSYEIFIILLTLFGGFYATIDLLRSKLFYLRITYFPLKFDEYNRLQYLRFVNFIILENIPQFFIQIWYLFFAESSDGSDQFLPIVFIALCMTIIGLIFGILKILKNGIEEKCACISIPTLKSKNGEENDAYDLSRMGNDYNIHSKLNFHFMIECSKSKFRKATAFCHKKIASSLKMVIDTCHDKHYWHGKNHIFYGIECYHIESQYHLNRLTFYFELNLFTRFDLSDDQTATVFSNSKDSTSDRGTEPISPTISNANSLVFNDDGDLGDLGDLGQSGDTGDGAHDQSIDVQVARAISLVSVDEALENEQTIDMESDFPVPQQEHTKQEEEKSSQSIMGAGEIEHEHIVNKLKQNIINMLDLNGQSDIANDWVSAMHKTFRMPDDAPIDILFNRESDLIICTTTVAEDKAGKRRLTRLKTNGTETSQMTQIQQKCDTTSTANVSKSNV